MGSRKKQGAVATQLDSTLPACGGGGGGGGGCCSVLECDVVLHCQQCIDSAQIQLRINGKTPVSCWITKRGDLSWSFHRHTTQPTEPDCWGPEQFHKDTRYTVTLAPYLVNSQFPVAKCAICFCVGCVIIAWARCCQTPFNGGSCGRARHHTSRLLIADMHASVLHLYCQHGNMTSCHVSDADCWWHMLP